jgi:hypothetical protein
MAGHPIYGRRNVRAVFSPIEQNPEDLNNGALQMVGHEFVWEFVSMFGDQGVYTLADREDLNSYVEASPEAVKFGMLWILEEDLEILGVTELDA